MGTKPGNSSSPAPTLASADFITNALVVLGIVASLTFIGGSALLNYRMGYTSADNPTDGIVYGSLAAAGDGLKALSPFVAAYGWRNRDWMAMTAATVIFVIFTAYSFTSSLGFSSQHRAVKEGTAAAEMERHQDARTQIDADRNRLASLGPQRSSAEVDQQLQNQLNSPIGSGRWTVDQMSDGCVKNKPVTRAACKVIAKLKEEKLRAEEGERLSVEIKSLATTTKTTTVIQSVDPQTDALAFLGRVLHLLAKDSKASEHGSQHAGFGLALLMALVIELGSGLGLYVATTPWRRRPAKPQSPEQPSAALPAIPGGPPLEAFAAERLQREPGQELHLAVAFDAYKKWCELHQRTVQGRVRFERGLLKLAKEIGLDVDSASLIIRDVAVRRHHWR